MTNTIKLYRIPIVIGLTQTNHGVRNNSLPFNDSDFKVFRNAYNPIDFIIRDNNRRPINVIGKKVVMTVWQFSRETYAQKIENRRVQPQRGEVILQKTAKCIDGRKGKIRVTFTPQETSEWEPLTYRYTMMIENEDKTHNMLAVDQNQDASGFFEYIDRVLPEPCETVVVTDFTPVNSVSPTYTPTEYISSAYPGDAIFREDNGLHTVAVYGTDYAGMFYVEATLEEHPEALDQDWFRVRLSSFFEGVELGNVPHPDCTFTGIEAFNFTASVRWVRFRHVPDMDNTGTIDQVLFRH
jgi:hypothetical protein